MTTEHRENNPLIGESPAFLEVLERVSRVAPLDKPVLVIGERGTGKELIAARLHFLSRRWDRAYVKLNCAALSETLLETELFGHEAGAFTGATRKHQGRFELANKGTLFLDELANTSGSVQEKILRVIEYGEFERVGGSSSVKSDVRIVAATNEDLPHLAQQGRFREDLLDRLAFDVITLPPLRFRRDDILPLAEHFATRMTRDLEYEVFSGFDADALEELRDYAWPGNVRELKNVVERAVYRADDPEEPISEIEFDPFDSPYRPQQAGLAKAAPEPEGEEPPTSAPPELMRRDTTIQLPSGPMDFKQAVQDAEISALQKALKENKFNQRKTAEHLGLTYHQLRGYLRKYDLLEK